MPAGRRRRALNRVVRIRSPCSEVDGFLIRSLVRAFNPGVAPMRRTSPTLATDPITARPRHIVCRGFRPAVLSLEDRTLLSLNATFTSVVASVGQAVFGESCHVHRHGDRASLRRCHADRRDRDLLRRVHGAWDRPLNGGVATLTTASLGSWGHRPSRRSTAATGRPSPAAAPGRSRPSPARRTRLYRRQRPATAASSIIPAAWRWTRRATSSSPTRATTSMREVKPDGTIITVAGNGDGRILGRRRPGHRRP